jgi:hypothetical protein
MHLMTSVLDGGQLPASCAGGNSHSNHWIGELKIGGTWWQWGTGARGSVVVKALCYKPEGHGFDSR